MRVLLLIGQKQCSAVLISGILTDLCLLIPGRNRMKWDASADT